MQNALLLILSTRTPFPIYGLRLLFLPLSYSSPSLQHLHPSKQLSQLNRP